MCTSISILIYVNMYTWNIPTVNINNQKMKYENREDTVMEMPSGRGSSKRNLKMEKIEGKT